MHTILIIEKLPVVRLGVRNLLVNSGFPHEIIESVSLQAVPAELSNPVSLIIIDPAQASESGDRLVYRIRRRFPGVPVLFFCGRDIDIYSPLAVRLGISGFIAKDGDEATVAAAVRMVLPACSVSRYWTLRQLNGHATTTCPACRCASWRCCGCCARECATRRSRVGSASARKP
ncbi:DNA-binding NarL/FixJ family response regulator [Kerstersia gyiorum]|uniref:response regulator n=1 Tax=Kerstersia gyiorum TaxID=206506 RepID=UPI00209E254F|nr:response regulator [Kerstersia gyiorum]MCP1637035.1 DNA-binding NarL/FixJ family response regulator [Kerstersia gyiorum]